MREGLVQLEKRVDQQNSNLVMLFSLVLMLKDLLKVQLVNVPVKCYCSFNSDTWLYYCYH